MNHWQAWVFFIGFLGFQVARAVGGVLLICLAAGLAGAMVGFIFGIPRQISAPPDALPAGSGGAAQPRTATFHQADNRWQLSTNLTQVSDWLTKIIVGVSLVEAKNVWGELQDLFLSAADWLFDMRHGSPALLGSVIVGGSIFGFLFSYMYTQLIVSRLLAAVAHGLTLPPPSSAARQILLGVQSFHEFLAPRISRSAHAPEPTDQPTQEHVRAALQYHTIRFDDLIARPNVSHDDVLNWSRAKAILNDYPSAAKGYVYLLAFWHGIRQP